MTRPRLTKPLPRPRGLSHDWIDPSSAWVQDEYSATPGATSEPYDWTPEDDTAPSPQVIPIPPRDSDGSAKLRPPKRKVNLPETSVLIPIEKVPDRVAESPRTEPRRKHSISSVLLLLLSVIALFVFAFIAQKHGM